MAATKIKTILHFTVAAGASVSLPHGLNWNNVSRVPDFLASGAGGDEVALSADATNVTAFNQGGEDAVFDVLCELWHTYERDFGDVAVLGLVPRPFIIHGGGGAGAIPTPPFVPLSDLNDRVIYARTTGSDTTGNGTLANPYRTVQRAVRDVPTIIPPLVQFIVDCTGIGTEIFPPDYTFPPFVSAEFENLDFSDFFFLFRNSLTFRADPELFAAIPAADAVIALADIASQTGDANTGIITLTLNAPRASWAADALKGALVFGAAGAAAFEACVVSASTNTTIELTTRAALTAPIQIMQPSAVWQGSIGPQQFLPGAAIAFMGATNVHFAGLRIPEPTGSPGFAGLAVRGTTVCCFLESCDIDSFQVETGDCRAKACNFKLGTPGSGSGTIVGQDLFFFSQQSLLQDGIFIASTSDVILQGGVIIDGGTFTGDAITIANRNGSVGYAMGSLAFRFSEIRNAPGLGLYFHGSNGLLQKANINACAGGAVVFGQGHGLLNLVSVKGTGNGGPAAVVANDGAFIEVDSATTVISAGPFAYKSGDLAAVAAWPGAPFNAFDITAVGAGGATGTGSRIFEV